MDEKLKFDYYYGIEAEQFSFYRVPRILIKDKRFKELSSDAKLLYGLMLDRMALSMKNGWFDSENRAYIHYTLENIMEDLNCAKEKCSKILAELDSKKGIGLIEKKRQGLGKPDIIYVKNFAVVEAEEIVEKESVTEEITETVAKSNIQKFENQTSRSSEIELLEIEKVGFVGDFENRTSRSREIEHPEVRKSNFKKSENRTSRGSEIELQEVGKSNFKKTENRTSGGSEIELQEVRKSNSNYTNNNYTDNSYNNLIYQSSECNADGMDEINAYMQIIRENIEYDYYMNYAQKHERELAEELYQLICDVVCVKRTSIRIGGEDYPYELVKAKFLKLNQGHIEYVMECMKNTTSKIGNIRSYLITTLYNAPNTMNYYYQQEVQHDLYGGNEYGVVGQAL